MAARRSHGQKKCLPCKARRMKCSETRPGCEQCSNHRLVSQNNSPSLIWSDIRIKSRPPTPSSSSSSTASEDSVDLMASEQKLNLEDLELMMNWCTATYRSLARTSAGERVWQSVVPRESLRNPFLMRGVLALSALHLAFTHRGKQQKEYLKTAQAHQTHALGGLTLAGAVSERNCNATFALSSLMIVFSIAFPLLVRPTSTHTSLDDLCRVFSITRRSIKVLIEIIPWVQDGEMGSLTTREEDPAPQMPDTSKLAILFLHNLNTTFSNHDPHHETAVYTETIQILGECLEKLLRGGEPSLIAFRWIHRLPARYLDLLTDRQPLALTILAHYCVILHHLRDRWWMGDWGTRILREISQVLGCQWTQSISWAIDATGFVPGT
ncbi:hypothetical protein ASPZODRAFT_136414 [Penicilliopsis zonata CBS 506.65]|uniref:Zn(2)-C6 fungal-type domain-containing protein n=1 Tax=Penicilliopsis zonata CBS 506.65 TaxID=1073090 RepID=A0A1L9S7T3_9EURO|nr:hypothetical protein ASPZODRAFT_136414 [Penicilliopsis zonata CBS 506.65]OJJ43218.1 hypothetical protein ASPZODRAFT_136414 [Penicilliopsis zonata CBS 506.65]